jgi:hypothetical protein
MQAQFFKSARDGNVEELEKALQSGVEIDQKDVRPHLFSRKF